MTRARKLPLYAAGVIEREDGCVLIAAASDQPATSRLWQFPRRLVPPGESPEGAMRRLAEDELGISVEIIEGRPPLILPVGQAEAELRYFFCGPITEPAGPGRFAEARWVPKAHIREYDFDPASKPVADWILAESAP